MYTHADYTNDTQKEHGSVGTTTTILCICMQPTQWCLCANALAAIAAWQVAQWTMTLRRVQGGKLVKQVELLHAGARSGAG